MIWLSLGASSIGTVARHRQFRCKGEEVTGSSKIGGCFPFWSKGTDLEVNRFYFLHITLEPDVLNQGFTANFLPADSFGRMMQFTKLRLKGPA